MLRSGTGGSWTHKLRVPRQKSFYKTSAPRRILKMIARLIESVASRLIQMLLLLILLLLTLTQKNIMTLPCNNAKRRIQESPQIAPIDGWSHFAMKINNTFGTVKHRWSANTMSCVIRCSPSFKRTHSSRTVWQRIGKFYSDIHANTVNSHAGMTSRATSDRPSNVTEHCLKVSKTDLVAMESNKSHCLTQDHSLSMTCTMSASAAISTFNSVRFAWPGGGGVLVEMVTLKIAY